MKIDKPRLAFTLLVLFGINTMNFFDRQVLGAVQESLKKDWDLKDKELGALGTAFILLYAIVGVPLGRWADLGRRTKILSLGAGVWSVLTALSGAAWGFWSLFVLRLGVGVGEASCAPAANSLIGDLFPPQRRARALSIFMLGLPLGLGLSFPVSAAIAQRWGWRWALCVAGLPGLVLSILALWIPEPVRGAAEDRPVSDGPSEDSTIRRGRPTIWRTGSAVSAGPSKNSPILQLIFIPTLWWIVLSGALHNFNMYANGQFLLSFLVRYHGMSQSAAGRVLGLAYGFGGFGILFGGWLCDRVVKRRISGRLEVATVALLIFVPCMFLSLQASSYWGFAAWFLPASLVSYVYYSGVYAAIQDIVEPALRGTAMALYFFAMYLLGASLGPIATGWASDYYAKQAALEQAPVTSAAWVSGMGAQAGAPGSLPLAAIKDIAMKDREAKAEGLHRAMYLIPWLGCALVIVLFAASRTVKRDYEKLQQRIAQSHSTTRSIAEKCS